MVGITKPTKPLWTNKGLFSLSRFDFKTVSSSSPSSLVDLFSVYLDHVFHPTLLEDDFKTEIYDLDRGTGVMWVKTILPTSFHGLCWRWWWPWPRGSWLVSCCFKSVFKYVLKPYCTNYSFWNCEHHDEMKHETLQSWDLFQEQPNAVLYFL